MILFSRYICKFCIVTFRCLRIKSLLITCVEPERTKYFKTANNGEYESTQRHLAMLFLETEIFNDKIIFKNFIGGGYS